MCYTKEEEAGAWTGALTARKFTGVSHYVHENAKTDWKFGRFSRNGMPMIPKGLYRKGGRGAEKRGD